VCTDVDRSGRAGRDGLPAKSILYYAADDKDRKRFLLENSLAERHQKKATKDGNAHEEAIIKSFLKVRPFGVRGPKGTTRHPNSHACAPYRPTLSRCSSLSTARNQYGTATSALRASSSLDRGLTKVVFVCQPSQAASGILWREGPRSMRQLRLLRRPGQGQTPDRARTRDRYRQTVLAEVRCSLVKMMAVIVVWILMVHSLTLARETASWAHQAQERRLPALSLASICRTRCIKTPTASRTRSDRPSSNRSVRSDALRRRPTVCWHEERRSTPTLTIWHRPRSRPPHRARHSCCRCGRAKYTIYIRLCWTDRLCSTTFRRP